MEEDRAEAMMEEAFVAELDRVEALMREKVKSDKVEKKEYWAAESVRLAATCGIKKKEMAVEAEGWMRLRGKNGRGMWMLKAAKPHRTKAGQASNEAVVRKANARRRQSIIVKMKKKKQTTQEIKEARRRRLAHHWKYLENTLKKEKDEKKIAPEVREKMKNQEKKAQEVRMAELDRLIEKRDRLIQERDLAVKREEKKKAIKKAKDAQMARAVNLRKALESIARRRGEKKIGHKNI